MLTWASLFQEISKDAEEPKGDVPAKKRVWLTQDLMGRWFAIWGLHKEVHVSSY